jgi:hypothetical protein
MIDIYYLKNNYKPFFKDLEELGICHAQNYVPIYSLFFSLNEKNYNSINLNHKFTIHNIKEKLTDNIYKVNITKKQGQENSLENEKEVLSFFKFSPLLDPIKYMVGKYSKKDKTNQDENQESNILENYLPRLNNSKHLNKKIKDTNNSAYIDSFFYYLSSKTLENHGFIHGNDFYGSFIGIKKNFIYNIIDDVDYLMDSDFFEKNNEKLFLTQNLNEFTEYMGDTRSNRKKISMQGEDVELNIKTIKEDVYEGIFELTEDNLSTFNKLSSMSVDTVFEAENTTTNDEPRNKSNKLSESSSSVCSSRSSNTDNIEIKDDISTDSESVDIDSESSSSSEESEEELNSIIYDFPVQMICLEKLDDTLDSLMELEEDDELEDNHWTSCLFQIIMMLITYQKMFDFTHNDLHTNNVMFKKTDKKYLIYKYNNVYYKVPTFGRIFKIIDYGRSIYKFKGKLFCSDSYCSKGDAASQYNFGPYVNKNKPTLLPNKSFDLCRLGCSLFDYFVEDLDDIDSYDDPLTKLVINWCMDDKGRNILYKNNGEERYPDFKLYKMITRSVHNHIPEKQLDNPLFYKYITTRKKIRKKTKVINIDEMPVYSN